MTMSKAFSVLLPNRGEVRIEGPDAVLFLNGLISNDVAQVSEDRLVYACLLTPQGKFLHDFFVRREGEALLLDCEGGDRAQDLHDRLMKFRLRTKVQMSVELKSEVYAVINGAEEKTKDPRHSNLGHRSYRNLQLEVRLFHFYDRLRIASCVPDGSRDMEVERSTLLECGIEKLNGIDWNKGCYMGQELTARMHYRGLAKKHLHVVSGDALPTPFTDLPNGGNMRSSSGDIGLAILRDDTIGTFDYAPLKVIT